MLNFFKKKRPTNLTPTLSKHKLREKKWERLQRRTLRWGVIRHYILLDELTNAQNIYEIKRIIKDWHTVNDIINGVDDFKINEHDFKVISRFFSIKRHLGLCDYDSLPEVSMENYNQIRTLNSYPYLLIVYDNYESYWDKVLSNYKRNSDKRKRLADLLENLDKDLSDPLILDNKPIQNRIRGLIDKYNTELIVLQ